MGKSDNDLKYEVGFASDAGLVKELNEDNYCAEIREDVDGMNTALLAISDGFGGFSLGEIASKIAINHIEKFFKLGEFDQMYEEAEILEPQRVIQELYTRINHVILSLAEKENRQVGCTLVSGFFNGSSVYVASAGNSRAYLIRGGGIKKLTEERADPMAKVNLDQLVSEESLDMKGKANYQNSLGSDITLRSDIHHLKAQDGDLFLICSDGLYSQLDEMEIVHTAAENPTMQAFCNSLIEKANLAEGKDNITVVALRVSKTKKTLRNILAGRRKGENFFTHPAFILAVIVGILLLFGTFIIANKFISGKRKGKKTTETDSDGGQHRRRSYNGMDMEFDIPVKYIAINNKTVQIEGKSEFIELEGDNNTVKIVPDLAKIKAKRKLYSFLMSGLKRNLAVVQGKKNKIVIDDERIKVFLTYGSRVDFVSREERAGEMFILRVNHLGSPMILQLKTEEEFVAKVELDEDAQKQPLPSSRKPKRSKPKDKKADDKKPEQPTPEETEPPLEPGEEGRM